MRRSKRPRASSASSLSPTAPTSPTSARFARRALHIFRPWTSSARATSWLTSPPSSAPLISCSERSTDERPPSRTTGSPAEGIRLYGGESRLGQEAGRQVSGRPPAVGGHPAAVARAGAVRRLATRNRHPLRRRHARHAVYPRARDCDLLHAVHAAAGRQK